VQKNQRRTGRIGLPERGAFEPMATGLDEPFRYSEINHLFLPGVCASQSPDSALRGVTEVALRRHDEVVAVQPFDLVRPPPDRHLAPLGQNGRVVPLRLGQFANLLREGERLRVVVEPVLALQLVEVAIALDLPVRNLRQQLGPLGLGHLGGADPAGFTLLLGQIVHSFRSFWDGC